MEIERIRKELNELLKNVVDHSTKYSGERPIPSLEVSFVMSKITKMYDRLSVLRHLLEENEKSSFQRKNTATPLIKNDQKKEEEKRLNIAKEVSFEKPLESPKDIPVIEDFEHQTISKLVDILTLNDRYLYANELFDKNMNSFNELVKTIDGSSSLNEVKALLKSYNWDEENEHVSSFYMLIERRFPE